MSILNLETVTNAQSSQEAEDKKWEQQCSESYEIMGETATHLGLNSDTWEIVAVTDYRDSGSHTTKLKSKEEGNADVEIEVEYDLEVRNTKAIIGIPGKAGIAGVDENGYIESIEYRTHW